MSLPDGWRADRGDVLVGASGARYQVVTGTSVCRLGDAAPGSDPAGTLGLADVWVWDGPLTRADRAGRMAAAIRADAHEQECRGVDHDGQQADVDGLYARADRLDGAL